MTPATNTTGAPPAAALPTPPAPPGEFHTSCRHQAQSTSGARSTLVDDIATYFPGELRARDQWVCWRLETRDGRPTKVPYSPVSAWPALSNKASSWGSFDLAAALLVACWELQGLGYVFSADDPYCGVDFDHCVDPGSGEVAPWASKWVTRLNSYTEFSPSGSGLHVILRGSLSGKGRKRNGIEIYDRGRFFTVTGRPLTGMALTVTEPEAELEELYRSLARKASLVFKDRLAQRKAIGPELPDAAVINAILASSRRIKFQQLWAGYWEARYGSQSEADLALTGMLSEHVGNNPTQIDRLFRQSGLFRPKWDEQRGDLTYGEKTIAMTLQEEA